jgi:transposase
MFPGNTFEGHTLLPAIKNLKSKYLISDILVVADRGMFNRKNLTELENEGVSFIVAAKLKAMKSDVKTSILDALSRARPKNADTDFSWTYEYQYEGKRLILTVRREPQKIVLIANAWSIDF